MIFLILACTTHNSWLLNNFESVTSKLRLFHLHNLPLTAFIYITFVLQIVTRSMPGTSLHWGLKQPILHPTVHYGNVWLLQIGKTQLISKKTFARMELMRRLVDCFLPGARVSFCNLILKSII